MLDIFTCVLGTLGFSILLKVSKQKLIFTVIGGTISSVIYYFMTESGYDTFKSTLFAMVAICVYSEIMARIIKTPANVILIPSTIPLLPGGFLYYTLSYLVHADKENFYFYGKETVFVGLGIALGAVIVSIFVTFINTAHKHFKKKKAQEE
ncbi:MAG: threonine/serine exporter family protein [Eubacterium sp.]|nr:threonine/serine exporter family protein [Eubacterium sp.]